MWLILGFTCLIIDIFVTQTLVLILFGLGSITTALLLEYNIIISFEHQVISFLGSTIFWSVLLWRPLSKIKLKNTYSEVIGGSVELLDNKLEPGETGKGRWSGTTVSVTLVKDSKTAVKGDNLKITEISGIKFFVTKNGDDNAA